MDAVEFVEQWRRMDKNGYRKYSIFNDSPEDVIAEVEEWAKMNPVKTRQSVFLEQYPEVAFDERGVMQLCPKAISAAHRGNNGECKNPEKLCIDCRREFWMQEVE